MIETEFNGEIIQTSSDDIDEVIVMMTDVIDCTQLDDNAEIEVTADATDQCVCKGDECFKK